MMSNGIKKRKSLEENELYTDYEILYGTPDSWAPEIVEEFEEKWNEIQEKYEVTLIS